MKSKGSGDLPDDMDQLEADYGTTVRAGFEQLRKLMEENPELRGSMHDPFFGRRAEERARSVFSRLDGTPYRESGETGVEQERETDPIIIAAGALEAILDHPWTMPIAAAVGKGVVILLMPKWLAPYDVKEPQWKLRKLVGLAAVTTECVLACVKAGKK